MPLIKKHLRILMSGALILVPVSVTVWLIVWIANFLGKMGFALLNLVGIEDKLTPVWQNWTGAIGIAGALAVVYVIGVLGNLWIFRWMFERMDQMLSRLPGIKTVYESVRDLMKLFGGGAGKMGYPVLYQPPGSDVHMLGIVTNENPQGRPEGDDSVIVYLPMGYMIGGPIVYVSPSKLQRVDMPVETALKLAATAFVGKTTPEIKLREDNK